MGLKNMTKLLILTGLIFVVALSGCLGGDDKTGNNTKESSAREAILSENDTILTFNFDENPSIGYEWTVTESQTGILNKTIDSYTSSSDSLGSSGIHTWVYNGETPGTVTLNYICIYRSDRTIENLTYVVEVKEDKSIEIISQSSSMANATNS